MCHRLENINLFRLVFLKRNLLNENVGILFTLVFFLSFTDTTAQLPHLQCPLVELDSITSQFFVYFTDVTAQREHVQCPLVEMDYTTSLLIVYRYDSTIGTFTVPSGGEGFYYFSAFLIADGGELVIFDVELNGDLICTVFSDLQDSPATDSQLTACNGVAYAVEGIYKTY